MNPHMEAKRWQLAHASKITLDCIHLDPEITHRRGRAYRDCLKGHGEQCSCTKPQTCGEGLCGDYEKPKEPRDG